MEHLRHIIRRLGGFGMAIGAAFLVGMMVLIVANIIYRLSGHVITGSYEVAELMIVVTVAFALGYAAIVKSHVVVKIIVSRFPPRLQALFEIITSAIALITWAAIAWASYMVASARWLSEESEMLLVPFLPFRLILVFGFIVLCFIFLIDLVKSLTQVVKR